ncbi:GNAT family N-acetyltransferase [Aliiroseovarius sp.]|uniref:GNAT family N-acetyltransferase n=1 Tax=Aliiroseovarius sp. TaxID=1872442 RepID=UPI003BABA1F8
MKSLEFATDLLVLSGRTEVEGHPDRIIQRTPDEPHFWFGNRTLFRDPPRDAAKLVEQFHADHPEARHICIGWDIPNLPLAEIEPMLARSGLTIEQADTLSLTGPLQRVATPDGLTLRAFQHPSDWTQSEEIAFHQSLAEGYPEPGLRRFHAERTRQRQTQVAKGLGQWFGAFDGDTLAGDMGIFHDDHLIRYQQVQTHPDHRRRGICSALLVHALDWAQARAPKATPVIVAEADSDAGRLYRRAGFALSETTISAYRAPR